eukprot:1035608-Pelagomonas_calceolata.AAC.1
MSGLCSLQSGQLLGGEVINVFTVASGHMYERLQKIMVLSVIKNTKSRVKFWFIKNYMSPQHKQVCWLMQASVCSLMQAAVAFPKCRFTVFAGTLNASEDFQIPDVCVVHLSLLIAGMQGCASSSKTETNPRGCNSAGDSGYGQAVRL